MSRSDLTPSKGTPATSTLVAGGSPRDAGSSDKPSVGGSSLPRPARTSILSGGVALVVLFSAVSLLLAHDDVQQPREPSAIAALAPAMSSSSPLSSSTIVPSMVASVPTAGRATSLSPDSSLAMRIASPVPQAVVPTQEIATRSGADTSNPLRAMPAEAPVRSFNLVGMPSAPISNSAIGGSSPAGESLAFSAAPASTNTLSSATGGVSGAPVANAYSVVPVVPQAVSLAAHPRLLLDPATLATLRQRATANTPQWVALKATCDSYIGGTVEYPTGNQYPNKPNLGSGYQGESYLPALLAEGMCYQVLKSSNASAAAPYGAKAVDILMKMSMPYPGSNGWDPCTDSGYGIRFYGVSYGLGYDWVYDLLTATQRTQIYTTANAWLTAWENPSGCASFAYVGNPIGNYFAGYFHAKAVIALGTYGENPSAPTEWTDWLNNVFGARVQPSYQLHMLGGGWPEGYGNYAPLSILNMSLPPREVKTATGVDLIHAAAPYSFPLDSADYAMHFTWPSLTYFDDRDDNHSNGNASSPPPSTTQVGLFQQILGTLSYWQSPEASVFNQYLGAVSKATGNNNPGPAWLQFLGIDPSAPTAALTTLPLSYFAPGMNAVSARSDWTTGASWMSFRAGPYVNNPGAGHEYFDQGSLALVQGGSPLLVNAGGWLVHEPNGNADETNVYNDNFGNFNGTPYLGNRQLYNVYYVRNMSGSMVAEQYGQAAYTTENNQVRTQVSAYEDGTRYVYVLATHLEDMYRKFNAGPAVAAWSREVVYLRPNRFVVFDRTTEGSAGNDQFLAWHFSANPAALSATAGQSRVGVTYNGKFIGAMTSVLPAGNTLTTIGLYPGDTSTKVWQIQERPASSAASQIWLTVFDLSTTMGTLANTSPVVVNLGGIAGVQLTASDGSSVVVSSTGPAGTALTGSIGYGIAPVGSVQVVTDLVPNTGYSATVASSGGTQNVTISMGGTLMSSAKGVLSFYVTVAGVVQPNPPAAPPPPYATVPVSSLPVPGFPTPYKP
ncbi:MAG TPA: hypothetical protein VN043_08065 [Rhodanobacter sp.]|nr:hypothetical protein [Rhodanobacter sp.]